MENGIKDGGATTIFEARKVENWIESLHQTMLHFGQKSPMSVSFLREDGFPSSAHIVLYPPDSALALRKRKRKTGRMRMRVKRKRRKRKRKKRRRAATG
jgi:hypothetical protein